MTDRALWTVDAMAAAMRARRAGPVPEPIAGLSIDSRTIEPGEAFFAIKGESRDGHAFVAAAFERGAGLAVVAADKRGEMPADAPLLIVPDVLAALEDLARAARARSAARIVAITGSVGKTGTKDALRLVLGKEGLTHASAASFNNQWGVPLSLARLPECARFGVFEIGMNHAGEITPLTQMARPHVAVITTVSAFTPLCANFNRCITPKRCCSSIMASPRFLNSTFSSSSACVPTATCTRPSASSFFNCDFSRPVFDPVSKATT